MQTVKVGAKLSCARCGVEVVVVKAPSAEMTCCGEPLRAPVKAPPDGDAAGGRA